MQQDKSHPGHSKFDVPWRLIGSLQVECEIRQSKGQSFGHAGLVTQLKWHIRRHCAGPGATAGVNVGINCPTFCTNGSHLIHMTPSMVA